MNVEGRLLRLGENLVGRACQRLPKSVRDERYREWTAELPAILHDPQIRFAPLRALRMLAYAADILGVANFGAVRARRQPRGITVALSLLLVLNLSGVAWDIWTVARAPAHAPNYATLVWALILVAYPIAGLVRGTIGHLAMLIFLLSNLAGLVVYVWNAAQSPGDWVNYLCLAFLFVGTTLVLLLWWLDSRWARASRA